MVLQVLSVSITTSLLMIGLTKTYITVAKIALGAWRSWQAMSLQGSSTFSSKSILCLTLTSNWSQSIAATLMTIGKCAPMLASPHLPQKTGCHLLVGFHQMSTRQLVCEYNNTIFAVLFTDDLQAHQATVHSRLCPEVSSCPPSQQSWNSATPSCYHHHVWFGELTFFGSIDCSDCWTMAQPFRFVECPAVCRFITYLNAKIQDSDIPKKSYIVASVNAKVASLEELTINIINVCGLSFLFSLLICDICDT